MELKCSSGCVFEVVPRDSKSWGLGTMISSRIHIWWYYWHLGKGRRLGLTRGSGSLGGLFLVAKSFSVPWLNLCSLLSEVTVWTALSHDAHPIMMNSRPKQNPSFIAVLDVLSQNTEVANVIPYYLESKYFQIKMSFLTCLVSTQLPALFPGRPLLYKLPLL